VINLIYLLVWSLLKGLVGSVLSKISWIGLRLNSLEIFMYCQTLSTVTSIWVNSARYK